MRRPACPPFPRRRAHRSRRRRRTLLPRAQPQASSASDSVDPPDPAPQPNRAREDGCIESVREHGLAPHIRHVFAADRDQPEPVATCTKRHRASRPPWPRRQQRASGRTSPLNELVDQILRDSDPEQVIAQSPAFAHCTAVQQSAANSSGSRPSRCHTILGTHVRQPHRSRPACPRGRRSPREQSTTQTRRTVVAHPSSFLI